MSLSCPKCNTPLPEHEGLEYRFCPRCGAEIKSAKKETDESYQTIPPDLAAAFEKTVDDKPVPDEDKKDISSPVNQTLAPDFTPQRKTRLEIKAPSIPPPSSFYRITAVDQELSSETHKQKQIGKYRWVSILLVLIMVILIVLAYCKFF
jgi:uncharacterized Zn finger protein (UPF0148 family)